MGKISPQERWKRRVIEHFIAFKQSDELITLRKKGMETLGRKTLFTAVEWSDSFSERVRSPDFMKWVDECQAVGERFGLASWVVARACLQEGYDPSKEPYVIEADWPQIRLITDNTDPDFLTRLASEAQKLGIYAVRRISSTEFTLVHESIAINDSDKVSPTLLLPPVHSAFHLRVETPPDYPPEAREELEKRVGRLAREILKRLGYSVPQRLRTSSLVSLAEVVGIRDETHTVEETYNIIDRTYGDEDGSKDQQRRKLIKSRRHKLRKRLIEPYKQNKNDQSQ